MANLKQMENALRLCIPLLEDECRSLIDGYTILYKKDPHFGELTPEGKAELRPWARALRAVKAALKE
jgi:hypothetical protein